MTFQARNYEQILTDSINHVRANSTLTDFTTGSAIRTILEASALEDDEQYFQMVQLLDAFRIQTATGAELDERAADYNLTRLTASASSGFVVYQDGSLATDLMLTDIVTGVGVTIYLTDTSDFPTAPFTVRLGEGTPQVEDVSISLNDTTANTLTAVSVVNSHSASERVSLVTGGAKTISSGQLVQVPAGGNLAAIPFTAIDTATIAAGNYQSGTVRVRSTNTGDNTNVAAGRISQFQGSPPFVGALVTNLTEISGGKDLETDEAFRARILRRIAELSRGTIYAIESAAIGIEDTNTGQRVVSSKAREDFINDDNHILYIDDGTGFTPSSARLAASTLNGAHGGGVSVLNVVDVTDFPDGGTLLVGPGTVAPDAPEVVTYSSKGPGHQLNLDAPTTASHSNTDEVLFVDTVGTAEEGQNFFQISNYPIVNNTLQLYDDSNGTQTLRTLTTDYVVNRTNGEVQYTGLGLPAGTVVLAHHTYYTGLVQEVQKTITGDPNDRINYPGVAAGGLIWHVGTPTIRRVSVLITISAQTGFDEIELRDTVQREIEAYINARKIGENVYRAKIIERAMQVVGVLNVVLQTPTADIIILEDELPVSYDASGDSLVTVL